MDYKVVLVERSVAGCKPSGPMEVSFSSFDAALRYVRREVKWESCKYVDFPEMNSRFWGDFSGYEGRVDRLFPSRMMEMSESADGPVYLDSV